jgi:hypothetical protein
MAQLPLKGKKVSPLPVPNDEAVSRARRIMEGAFPEIAQVLTDAARDGDVGAGRLIAERLMPVARSTPIRNPIALTGDATAQVLQVKDAIASGRLALEEGEALLHAIDVSMKVSREMYQFRRSEELWAALVAEIEAESPECQERIMRRIARLQNDRGLVIAAKAEDVPAPLPKGEASDDVF